MITKKALANFTKFRRIDFMAEIERINQREDENARRVIDDMMREEFKFWVLTISILRNQFNFLYKIQNGSCYQKKNKSDG